MIKRIIAATLVLMMIVVQGQTANAAEGEMGFFGGISEGEYLPKTVERYVPKDAVNSPVYAYKEVIFMSGKPVTVVGTITVTIDNADIEGTESGEYGERYQVEAANETAGVTINRNIQLNTSYYYKEGAFKRQLIKDSTLQSWTETITTGDATYTMDDDTAIFSKATVEDITPGVSYYNTTLSYSGTYYDANGESVMVNMNGNMYGYKQPYSKVETQHMTLSIDNTPADFNMTVEMNPRLEAKKSIYYDQTQPYPISFGGTYNQRMEREATLDYTITSYHPGLKASEKSNSILLTTANQVEKLPIPEGLDFIEGHWAEEDLKKLYSMEIFTEVPHNGMQFEAMTRGEYVKALCLAMRIDISDYEDPDDDAEVIFADVPPQHPLYPYIMGADEAKLVNGTGAKFDVNRPITREEAFVIYIRVIGLERLGVTGSPTTPFTDDASISSWAKREIVAGYRLGIIQGNASGEVQPKRWISKVEAAAIINRLIDYLRDDIGEDY